MRRDADACARPVVYEEIALQQFLCYLVAVWYIQCDCAAALSRILGRIDRETTFFGHGNQFGCLADGFGANVLDPHFTDDLVAGSRRIESWNIRRPIQETIRVGCKIDRA